MKVGFILFDLQLVFCEACLKYFQRFALPPLLSAISPVDFSSGAVFDSRELFLGFVQLFFFQSARELKPFKYANFISRAPSFALLIMFGDSRRLFSGF